MNNSLNATDPSGYFLEGLVKEGLITVALYAINPALGTAYAYYNAVKATAAFVQAYEVWQGGGGGTGDLVGATVNAAMAIWGAYEATVELGNATSDLKNSSIADASGTGELPEGAGRPITTKSGQ